MTVDSQEPSRLCAQCGGPLSSGPLGLRCARCVLGLASAPEDDAAAQVAELFPELRLEGEIARGGFSTVFRAEHRRMKRPVALKFLDTLLARSAEAVALFEQEMITVGGLDHPGIVRAHDAGERDGRWFILMEFMDGQDCGALVRRHGKLPIAESCEIIRQAALALHYAHGQGLVHRDVKPGNIMVSGGVERTKGAEGTKENSDALPSVPSTVKVLDFGLASLVVAPIFGATDSEAGRFLGTLEYVAPEQIEAPNRVDARADVYGLGATLRRMLTGLPMRESASEQSLFLRMKAITAQVPPPIATVRAGLPRELARLCDQMVALDRNDRPASAAEVARLLEPWCAGAELARLFTDGPLAEKPIVRPKKSRRPLWIAAAVIAVLVVISTPLFQAKKIAVPAVAPAPNWKPVFSEAYARVRQIEEKDQPRLYSKDWEHESEFIEIQAKECGHFTPDGQVVSIDKGMTAPLRLRKIGREAAAVKLNTTEKVRMLGVAPSGHVVWAQHEENTGLHIGRARPDGTPLPFLRYDFASEFPPGVFEQKQNDRLKLGKPVRDGEPFGFAFVTADNLPKNTDLKPGDVLVADLGHRTLGTGPSAVDTDPGLWRFRLDDDAPARRLARGDQKNWLVDVALSRHGVFALDRIKWDVVDISDDDPRHFTDHLLRWDRDGWHKCTFDQPIVDVCGLAADPLSEDLYIIQGANYPTVVLDRQSVRRLRRTGPDRYAVEVFANHFGKMSFGGIAFSYDGQKMILTDAGNHAIAILKRKK